MFIDFRQRGGGREPVIEALNVTENGTYTPQEGIDGYSPVDVNVPIPAPKTEEKTVSIVANGQTVVDKSASVDGMTKVTVDVAVPIPAPALEALTVTGNGSYTPGEGVDGYNKVDVNVPGGVGEGMVNFGLIGYDNTEVVKLNNEIAYSAEQKKKFENGEIQKFHNDNNLIYAPKVVVPASLNGSLFNECHKLIKVPALETTGITSIASFFRLDDSLEEIGWFDTSKCTNANSFLLGCRNLKKLPDFDFSNIEGDVSWLFSECKSLETIPASMLDFSKKEIGSAYLMFSNCTKITDLSALKIAPTNMDEMFKNVPLSSIPAGLDVSRTKSLEKTFSNGSSSDPIFGENPLTVKDIVLGDMPEVEKARQTFINQTNIKTIKIGNMPKVKEISSIFSSCENLEKAVIGDTPLLEKISYIFDECISLKEVSEINASSVTSMSYPFGYTWNNNNTLTIFGGFKNIKINLDVIGHLEALTKESVMNIINGLYDFRGNGDASTTKTVKLNAKPFALLTPDDIAIATAKGWNVVSQ